MIVKLRLASNERLEDELRRVLDFYQSNAHPQVRERAPEVFRNAITRSALLVLEDEQQELIGSCAQITHAQGAYSETGGVRILKNGWGFQTLMMGICAINEFLFAPPTHEIFAITASGNEPSIKSIIRAGFIPSVPNAHFESAVGYATGFPADKRFFQFTRADARPVRDRLLDLAKVKSLTRQQETMGVIVEHPLFRPENLRLMEQI